MNLIERLETIERRLYDLESSIINDHNLVNERLNKLYETVGLDFHKESLKTKIEPDDEDDEVVDSSDDETSAGPFDDPYWRIFNYKEGKYLVRISKNQHDLPKKPFWTNRINVGKIFDTRNEALEFIKQNKLKNVKVT